MNFVGGRFQHENIDRIKPYQDWREYLRAGFTSGHGPASGSRRVLASVSRRYVPRREGERGRERSVEREKDERRWKGDGATRRDTRQTEREGTDGTHNQPNEQSLCVISDACAPRRPNLQSSSYTSSSDRISTRFFHQLFHSIPRTVDAEALVSLRSSYFFLDFLFPALSLIPVNLETCVSFFLLSREFGRKGEERGRIWMVFFCF